MRRPQVDDFVKLTQDVPELSLARGDVGVVRSTWFAPEMNFEVEFRRIGHDYQMRALLQPDQVEVEDRPLPGDEPPEPGSEPNEPAEFIQG